MWLQPQDENVPEPFKRLAGERCVASDTEERAVARQRRRTPKCRRPDPDQQDVCPVYLRNSLEDPC